MEFGGTQQVSWEEHWQLGRLPDPGNFHLLFLFFESGYHKHTKRKDLERHGMSSHCHGIGDMTDLESLGEEVA